MGVFYSEIGQGLQSSITGMTIFIALTILLIFVIIAVIKGGYKNLFTKGRIKWLLINTAQIFVVGYTLGNFELNKYLEVIIFALLITLITKGIKYLMYHEKWENKVMLKWFAINLITFYFIMILFEVVPLTDNLLRIFFGGILLTLIGAMFYKPKFSHHHH